MRILGMMMIFISCSGIGIMFSYIYKKRLEELNDWKKGVVMLKNEINFSLTPLAEAFEMIAHRLEGNIQLFLYEIGDLFKLDHFQAIEKLDDKHLEKSLLNTCLNQKDRRFIIQFVKNLGALDKESQINNLMLHIEQIELELENSRNNEVKNNKLFKTLGILSGIFVIVIFI